ncbi:MAG: hypothetical protein IKD04_03410 [Clostridia bacterium]|nr:hypothetical protein [Clostridia bacterium]
MLKILIQKFIDDKPQFNRSPYQLKEAIEMELPKNFECIVIHRLSSNTINVYGISKEYETEVIVL